MILTRREFLKAASSIVAALGLSASGLIRIKEALAAEGGVSVVWLQGQGCSGCSVSLLNTIYHMTIDQLLVNTIDLEYHPTVMAAAGDLAVGAIPDEAGYVLVVEGAIPTANGGKYCYLWPDKTALAGVQELAQNAAAVLAVGTCAAYGGMAAGAPNPTGAVGVRDVVSGTPVINIPGCPAHPDWIVGTVAALLAGQMPTLDAEGRPVACYGDRVHQNCPNKGTKAAKTLGEPGCLRQLGCKGQWTMADCPSRRWNSGAEGADGVNWCVGARAPCQGCTEPSFPDGMSPFYNLKRRKRSREQASALPANRLAMQTLA